MTIENTINNFSTNIGNAVTLGKHFLTIVDHVVEKRDTTPIVKIHNAAINRNDKDIASAIRFTLKPTLKLKKLYRFKSKMPSFQIVLLKLYRMWPVAFQCVALIGKMLSKLIVIRTLQKKLMFKNVLLILHKNIPNC